MREGAQAVAEVLHADLQVWDDVLSGKLPLLSLLLDLIEREWHLTRAEHTLLSSSICEHHAQRLSLRRQLPLHDLDCNAVPDEALMTLQAFAVCVS